MQTAILIDRIWCYLQLEGKGRTCFADRLFVIPFYSWEHPAWNHF